MQPAELDRPRVLEGCGRLRGRLRDPKDQPRQRGLNGLEAPLTLITDGAFQ